MYVHIVYVRIYIYVPIVGGIGGPLQDKFWADFGAKKLGQKNRDHHVIAQVIRKCKPKVF